MMYKGHSVERDGARGKTRHHPPAHMRFLLSIFSLLLLVTTLTKGQVGNKSESTSQDYTVSIPAEGNCWVANAPQKNRYLFSPNTTPGHPIPGAVMKGWSPAEDTIHLYFHTNRTGNVDLAMVGRNPGGSTRIRLTHGQVSKVIVLSGATVDTIDAGNFEVTEPGYQCVQITADDEGIPDADKGEIYGFLLGGAATAGTVNYVRGDFYWGKRGPSVHLSYPVPEEAGDIAWFYNEITVPEGEDVLGSYYMANGFAQGYFGMQVNSPEERRILFSVWSPYHTDDPSEIPDDQKIRMLNRGPDVYTGEFGNEGSGGQSYLRYNWKAGQTYGFLLRGEPSGDSSTVFTAWFFAPEENSWRMIASFRRPKTDSHLLRLHSFLENFNTSTGAIARKGLYGNQWVCNTRGEWYELTRARFTADATARKNARLDYAGGADGRFFFLKNCGFTNDHTAMDTWFERPEGGRIPKIDLQSLPE